MNTQLLIIREPVTASRTTRYELECVWPNPPASVRDDVIDFWLREGALPDRTAADERSNELLVVARDELGRVAGVSTAAPALIPQLGFHCFYYRSFVGSAHRARGLLGSRLIWNILRESYAVLNRRFLQGYDPHVLGGYAEIESQSIMRTLRKLV